MIYPIVFPLHGGGGALGDDSELRYAIRSLVKFAPPPLHLYIAGPKLPVWAKDIELINSPQTDLKGSLRATAQRFPDGFFWWYDDLVLVKEQSEAQLMVTPAGLAGLAWTGSNSWSKGLEEIRNRLVKEGYSPVDYSHPHGPYWFDKSMVDEGFADWGDRMKGRFPWESWVLSKRQWPHRFAVVCQHYGKYTGPPNEQQVFVNFDDVAFKDSEELRSFLKSLLPKPSPYEADAVLPLDVSLEKAWKKHFQDERVGHIMEVHPGNTASGGRLAEKSDKWTIVEPMMSSYKHLTSRYQKSVVLRYKLGTDLGTYTMEENYRTDTVTPGHLEQYHGPADVLLMHDKEVTPFCLQLFLSLPKLLYISDPSNQSVRDYLKRNGFRRIGSGVYVRSQSGS